MTDQSIEQDIQAAGKTAPRITPKDIENNIVSELYFTAGDGVIGAFAASEFKKTSGDITLQAGVAHPDLLKDSLKLLTFCVLVLRNGFTVTGESACASPANFSEEIGRKIALANAISKIWPLMGYALKSELTGNTTVLQRARDE